MWHLVHNYSPWDYGMLYINCLFNQSFVKFEVHVFTYFWKICLSFIKLKVSIKYIYSFILDHFNARVIVFCMTPDDVQPA